MKPWIVVVFVALLSSLAHAARSTPPTEIRWEPYETTGSDGATLKGELGRLRVPENRSKPSDKTIEIACVRFRSTSAKPGPPIVYFVGGPGPSGIEYCVRPATGRLVRLLDFGDVIGVDQRGTGLSVPNLEAGPKFEYALPLDRAVTRAEYVAAYQAAAERSVAHWRAQGVDLSAYNTRESAADIEDLRRALGLERIITWGESYGTHLSLAYLREYAKQVARSVMLRVEGPDHTWKLPSTTQRHLEQLHALVQADPKAAAVLPDFLGSVRALLAGLEKEPARAEVERDGVTQALVLGKWDLQTYLADSLGSAFALRDVPAAILRMTRGDWSALAEHALDVRHGEVGSAMALWMDCSSNGSRARLEQLARETLDARNLLGDLANGPYPMACAACGAPDLGPTFRAAFECDTPVLFVSGNLDARTPPGNVDELIGGFKNAVHVVATNAGHEPIEVLSEDFRVLLSSFLRGERVESRTVELPSVRFRGIE